MEIAATAIKQYCTDKKKEMRNSEKREKEKRNEREEKTHTVGLRNYAL